MELIAATSGSRSNNLVFTSAGDRANLCGWLQGRRDFDLRVVYYGEQPGTFQEVATDHVSRQGSNFQNLNYCYRQWPRNITTLHATAKLRYTNFFEMACPLCRRDKLDTFMAVYDPELVGYGVDRWFLHTLGTELDNHVAVVDEVTCINPYDRSKGGVREIDTLQFHEKRKEVWERMKALHGLDEQGRQYREFRRINPSSVGAAAGLLRNLPDWAYFNPKRLARRLVPRATRRQR